jgi:hypothetical protein
VRDDGGRGAPMVDFSGSLTLSHLVQCGNGLARQAGRVPVMHGRGCSRLCSLRVSVALCEEVEGTARACQLVAS